MLIKRGFGITLDESLNAAEYLATEGNRKVVFCLRGMKTNIGDPHRNFVDFAHVPVVKRLTRMPVCDRSVALGRHACARARRHARHLPRRRAGRHRRREHGARRLPPEPGAGARRRAAGAAAVRAARPSSTTSRSPATPTTSGRSLRASTPPASDRRHAKSRVARASAASPRRRPRERRCVDSYRAPRWLAGGHAQTIWPYRLQRPAVALRRERDRDARRRLLGLRLAGRGRRAPDAPLVVLFHGLEGSSDSHYARALLGAARRASAGAASSRIFAAAAASRIACRAPITRATTQEIGAMLDAIRRTRSASDAAVRRRRFARRQRAAQLARAAPGRAAAQMVTAAAAVSAPLDLMAAGVAIGQGVNRIYTVHFLATLKPKSLAMAQRFPGLLDPARIRRVRTMWEFDDAVTAPLHGFAGAADYWTPRVVEAMAARASRVPTLVLNARNDPFIPAESLPTARDVSRRGHARAAARTAGTSASRAAVSGPRRLAAARGCYTTSLSRRAAAFDVAASPHACLRRNLQGLRHPRHRRPHADARRSCARSARRSAASRASASATRSPSAATAGCRGPSSVAALGDGIRARGVERDRRRHGRDADDVFRRAASRHRSAA